MAAFKLTAACVRENVIFGLPDEHFRVLCMNKLTDKDLRTELARGWYDCPWDPRQEEDAFYEWLDSTCPEVMAAAAKAKGVDVDALLDRHYAQLPDDHRI